ncbi:hypothetical protein PIB30_014810 [Stylosanthes scabra]|uniref:Nudix hydrolase domain-containing protein n=1 Tax=Stylosanthes scabra TaxID=79078 RepID=A0ABU6Q6N9_9FABA|nr:hypothetical protein [Stylosanthes scabra]
MVEENNKVVGLVSRTGRALQRYRKGRRQVVGCIPYRYNKPASSLDLEAPTSSQQDQLQVLLITSKKGKGMLFPKGGWELDESKKEAALRESIEEAGVRGLIQGKLGRWSFKSKSQDTWHEGYMFPLLVQEQFDFWPERNHRQRTWMSISEAREMICQQWWMKEALERLVNRLTPRNNNNKLVDPIRNNNI